MKIDDLTTFVGFAKDQPSMVKLIAFTLRIDHDQVGGGEVTDGE